MQTAKQEAINVISSLPDTTSTEEIMYRLYVIDKIKRGFEAIDNGETVSLEELEKEVESW